MNLEFYWNFIGILIVEHNLGFPFGVPGFIFCSYMGIYMKFKWNTYFLLTSDVPYTSPITRDGTKVLFGPESCDVNGLLASLLSSSSPWGCVLHFTLLLYTAHCIKDGRGQVHKFSFLETRLNNLNVSLSSLMYWRSRNSSIIYKFQFTRT